MSLIPRFVPLFFLATTVAMGAYAQDSTPTTPVPAKTNGEEWWNEQFQGVLSRIKAMEGKIDLAFIGDSITARWGSGEEFKKHWGAYRAVNMGIGGDSTQHVLWRNENGQLDGYKARVFVLLIGTNNCWEPEKTDTAAVAAGVKAIITQIQTKQPQAKILLLSILPCGDKKPNAGRDTRDAVTDLISKFAGGSVHYMDIRSKFLEPDGSISKEVMHDALHLAPKGFDIWAETTKEKVKELMGDSGKKTP